MKAKEHAKIFQALADQIDVAKDAPYGDVYNVMKAEHGATAAAYQKVAKNEKDAKDLIKAADRAQAFYTDDQYNANIQAAVERGKAEERTRFEDAVKQKADRDKFEAGMEGFEAWCKAQNQERAKEKDSAWIERFGKRYRKEALIENERKRIHSVHVILGDEQIAIIRKGWDGWFVGQWFIMTHPDFPPQVLTLKEVSYGGILPRVEKA